MRKLGRNSAARKALLRSILTSFFKYGRIETTEAKAKELRSLADGLITLAKRGDLSARRQAIAALAEEDVVRKLFGEIAEKYTDRKSGYPTFGNKYFLGYGTTYYLNVTLSL